ncbi:hypothetical protein [Jiella sp. M17.18]|uniref:hypothetical protein n=1 Tax=Jiella sp. M17.18 TaxID=3234247 RepID=UPI0034DF04E9
MRKAQAPGQVVSARIRPLRTELQEVTARMPQWIIDLFGEGVAQIVWVAFVAAVVCILAMLVIILAKKALGGGRIGTGPKSRAPRLAVMDVARVDEKRKLVLVRRDEIEHLVLIGGQNDLLVEGNILRVPAAANARHHDWPAEPTLALEPDERVVPQGAAAPARPLARSASANRAAPVPGTPGPQPQPESRREPAAPAQRRAATAAPRPSDVPRPAPVPPMSAPERPVAKPDHPPRDASPRKTDGPAAIAANIVRQYAARMQIPGGARAEPPPAAAPAVQPRSRATPTLAPQPREDASDRAPKGGESAAPGGSARREPADSRREPSLTMPEPKPQPPIAPAADEQGSERAALREQMNRSQSALGAHVGDATAAPVETGSGRVQPQPRRPLSVKSFAMAIQNRGTPAASTEPQEAKAPPAQVHSSQSATAANEPSLEDFLSAQLDSDFSDAAFFDPDRQAGPSLSPSLSGSPVSADPDPSSAGASGPASSSSGNPGAEAPFASPEPAAPEAAEPAAEAGTVQPRAEDRRTLSEEPDLPAPLAASQATPARREPPELPEAETPRADRSGPVDAGRTDERRASPDAAAADRGSADEVAAPAAGDASPRRERQTPVMPPPGGGAPGRMSPRAAPPPPARPVSGKPDARPEVRNELTLEEEMERLLGDLSFATGSEDRPA